MLSAKDVAIVFETLLASPGMNDSVKISFNIPRKNALLLSKVIELGVEVKEDAPAGLLQVAGKEVLTELKEFSNELLQKAGLVEMHNKINALQFK